MRATAQGQLRVKPLDDPDAEQVVESALHREPVMGLRVLEQRLVNLETRVMGEDVRLEHPLEPGGRHAGEIEAPERATTIRATGVTPVKG